MYDIDEVQAAIDGLAVQNICKYRQPSGMCTGVSMEWVRRILLGDKTGKSNPNLYPKETEEEMSDDVFLEKLDKKDAKRLNTQKMIYAKSKNAFDSHYESNPSHYKCLSEWAALDKEWEAVSSQKGDPVKKYDVRKKIDLWAKKFNITAVPPGIIGIGEYLAGEANRDAYDHDYDEWRKTVPIEVAVFKRYSEDVERMYFDDELTTLQARFKGMKVIESANSLKIQTQTAWEAVQHALRNQQFAMGRGMVFGILGKDIAHSLGLFKLNDDDHLWMDPNYGVWWMKQHGIVATMKYLFDATGKADEAGVYQVNGGGTPTGFEYSVWGQST